MAFLLHSWPRVKGIKKGYWGRWEGGSKPAMMSNFSEISVEEEIPRSKWCRCSAEVALSNRFQSLFAE